MWADRGWHDRNSDYDVERRLSRLKERLEQAAEAGRVVKQERPPLCRLPAEHAVEEFGVGRLAVLLILGRLLMAGRDSAGPEPIAPRMTLRRPQPNPDAAVLKSGGVQDEILGQVAEIA